MPGSVVLSRRACPAMLPVYRRASIAASRFDQSGPRAIGAWHPWVGTEGASTIGLAAYWPADSASRGRSRWEEGFGRVRTRAFRTRLDRGAQCGNQYALGSAASCHAVDVCPRTGRAQARCARNQLDRLFADCTAGGRRNCRCVRRDRRSRRAGLCAEPSMGSKWVELLKELVPDIRNITVIFNPDTAPSAPLFVSSVEAVKIAGRVR